jgi:hypothetical protein
MREITDPWPGLVAGEAFVDCDGFLVRLQGRRCGLGFELALVVPLLALLRRRRHRGGAGERGR